MNQFAEHNIKVICIIPAAGKSSRFRSGNKLSALIEATEDVLSRTIKNIESIECIEQIFVGLNSTDIEKLNNTLKKNWIFQNDYSFGGYGKVSSDLIEFINKISINHKILFDPIYNGKMLFGIFDLIKKKQWRWGKKILVIHSGGLQGIIPMNLHLQKRKLPILNYGNL